MRSCYPLKRPKCSTRSEAQTRKVVLYSETSAVDRTCLRKTRSGRTSVQPVPWWISERIEFSDSEAEDDEGKFLLRRIKRDIRTEGV